MSTRASTVLLSFLLATAACEAPTPTREPAAPVRAPPETTMIPVIRPPPRIVARDSLPARIFYDLTRFDWYAHEEPLLWADQQWQPRGNPLALATESLERVGEFEGVDVWVRVGEDPVTRLYVPVSEGYWLPFAPTGPRQ